MSELSERIFSYAPSHDRRGEVLVQLFTLRKWAFEVAALETALKDAEAELEYIGEITGIAGVDGPMSVTDCVIALKSALKDAEDEIAKLNYIDLPNEKVSNVFEAYLAWKSRAQASEKQVTKLQDALEGDGDRNLLALFVLQDKLGDLLPDLGLCSGLDLAIEIMRKALKDAEDKVIQQAETIKDCHERTAALTTKYQDREAGLREKALIMQDNAINSYNRCCARQSNEFDNAFAVWAEPWQELGTILSEDLESLSEALKETADA